ncbi:MAG: hypothetical protein M3373_00285, partial [Gemmatimonadota bacterium]|nr:hypothetical protein [Gemmatimonadota bacterium]
GLPGNLYPSGNWMPSAHHSAGVTRAQSVRPLNVNGTPSASGKYVLMSLGMSNTSQEFCNGKSGMPCHARSFMGRAAADPAVNHTTLAVVNGASSLQVALNWDNVTDANFDRVRDSVLAPRGLSERQVQIIWVKLTNASPKIALLNSSADAYALEATLGRVVRAIKVRYPNIRQVFVSSRIYAGYATTALNPEPYAYETGFSVKWLVGAQISQMQTGTVDPRAGNLNYSTVAPWIAWGPYLWANGTNPRSDGLVWQRSDFAADGLHPSAAGEAKVATKLLDFFKTSPHTRCWFVVGATC